MDINPFDILKNAKEIQAQFGKIQEELSLLTTTGSAGGGIVKATLNGQFELINVELDPITVDPRDITMLQDLIVAAHADAIEKMRSLIKEKLGPYAAGLQGMSSL
ncbi:YbaB/EbfC family nucleoid-associated protein [Brucepastera parasyntrophica]|uniref:YbaB/EbfC family nucleoid-associated protein n=1 Tax=Brucepastera parasyntrophica TaxID=2880008 RepID=UPI0021096924|nr:YbaB/EbfC family nucleoid-associated protein [Brucepastera parasyntrophica]ULQ58986.1 YbaB/EbfC family nucleoid-associated protein [Brucepastera parasyntrophica]